MVEFEKGKKVRVMRSNGSRIGEVGILTSAGNTQSVDDKYWRIDFENDKDISIYQKHLELVNPNAKPKIPTHLVVWDTDCGDPHKEVYSEAEAKREVLKLYDKRDVINTSIKVYKVSEVKKPILRVGFEKA